MMCKIWLLHLAFLAVGPLWAQPSPGDINGDGAVDQADVDRGVEIALGQPPSPSQNELVAGDLNGDGQVTVQDLVLLVNTIAGANLPPVADAGASPESGLVGNDIQLDAARSFDLDDDELSYRWRQLHMDRFSTEYMTENEAVLDDSANITSSFNPEWPGRYRFELQVTDAAGLVDRDTVDVLVGKEGVRRLDPKGIVFWDLFGEVAGPEYDVTPEDPEELAAVQHRAMQAPVRANAEWIQFIPVVRYLQINPVPVIRAVYDRLDLTYEHEFAAIVNAAKTNGLKVSYEQGDVSAEEPELRQEEIDSLDVLANTSVAWWEQWFVEFENILLARADWMQKYGVDMFVIMHHADWTFRPAVFPQYGDRWRDIIRAIRDRYTGQIAIHVYGWGDLNFADALDAVQVGFPAVWLQLADPRNPTLEEIRIRCEDIFDDLAEKFPGQVPIQYLYSAVNSDAQVYGEFPPPLSELDNREQVIYYEAFFQALHDADWISGMFSERWDWFEEQDKPGTHGDDIIGSPRGKPAEEVVKLWFGIY